MEFDPSDVQVLEALLDSDDDLHQKLGAALLGGNQMGLGPKDLGEAARWAKGWLNTRGNIMAKAVCLSDVRQVVRDGGADDIAAVAAIIYTQYPDAIAAIAAAAILLRRGLDNVCAVYDE